MNRVGIKSNNLKFPLHLSNVGFMTLVRKQYLMCAASVGCNGESNIEALYCTDLCVCIL